MWCTPFCMLFLLSICIQLSCRMSQQNSWTNYFRLVVTCLTKIWCYICSCVATFKRNMLHSYVVWGGLPWRWCKNIPLKHWFLCAKLCGMTSKRTDMFTMATENVRFHITGRCNTAYWWQLPQEKHSPTFLIQNESVKSCTWSYSGTWVCKKGLQKYSHRQIHITVG